MLLTGNPALKESLKYSKKLIKILPLNILIIYSKKIKKINIENKPS